MRSTPTGVATFARSSLLALLSALALSLPGVPPASAQEASDSIRVATLGGTEARNLAVPDSLAALLRVALGQHPEIEAARARIRAVEARVPQAGVLPDPTLTAGLMNLPIAEPSLSAEGMTMFSIEVMQRFPAPGVRAARTARARAEVASAVARLEILRRTLTLRFQEAYFDLLLVEHAEAVHHRTHASLEAIAASARTAYTQGRAPQQDLLRAQTALAGIEEHLAELRQRRSSARAEVNALLGRDSRAPVTPRMPDRLAALLAADAGPGLLTSFLGDAELGGGLPTLEALEAEALRARPELELARAALEASGHEVEGARRDRRPGLAVSGGYGMRSARPDLISAAISIELPVFRSRNQDSRLLEAQAARDAARSEVEALEREIRREVADAHAVLLRTRERILLLQDAVIPQARATVESSTAAYRAGSSEFVSLMESYTLLFRNEIDLAHLTAELGRDLARLEWAVGTELWMEDLR